MRRILLLVCGLGLAWAAEPTPAPKPAEVKTAEPTSADAKPAAAKPTGPAVIDPKAVTYEGLPDDRAVETPWANIPTTAESDPFLFEEIQGFRKMLATWAPAKAKDPYAAVQACLALAALADVCRTPYEADAAPILFEHLQGLIIEDDLAMALARVALHPEQVTPLRKIDAFALEYEDPDDLRMRMAVYARKMLGRLLHKLP